MVKRNLYSEIAASGGFGFNVFNDEEINKIHLATLEVMEKTGLYVGTPEAMDVLESGGAKVDREKKIAKFPSYLVEDCIRSAPHNIVLYGRDPRHDVVLEDKRVNFCTFGQGVSCTPMGSGLVLKAVKPYRSASFSAFSATSSGVAPPGFW